VRNLGHIPAPNRRQPPTNPPQQASRPLRGQRRLNVLPNPKPAEPVPMLHPRSGPTEPITQQPKELAAVPVSNADPTSVHDPCPTGICRGRGPTRSPAPPADPDPSSDPPTTPAHTQPCNLAAQRSQLLSVERGSTGPHAASVPRQTSPARKPAITQSHPRKHRLRLQPTPARISYLCSYSTTTDNLPTTHVKPATAGSPVTGSDRGIGNWW